MRSRAHLTRPVTGDPRLMRYVDERLRQRWSPKQIAGRLNHHAPPELQGRSLRHTTIYRWIWSDPDRARKMLASLGGQDTILYGWPVASAGQIDREVLRDLCGEAQGCNQI